jgi:hypothetical protein
MEAIELGPLAAAPHADVLRAISTKCFADDTVQAVWVGGSLAAGRGDVFSDIDLRIAVEPGKMEQWTNPDWSRYLPLQPCGASLLPFGEHALLHHLLLSDGTLVDFYVQDTHAYNPEPQIVVLACRNNEFRTLLDGFIAPPAAMVQDLNPQTVRQFLVDYWIATHKQIKALARNYQYSAFVGLYVERIALLRAYYMQVVGKEISPHPSLHMLGTLHRDIASELSAQQREILGLPTRTAHETMLAIEAVRKEMSQIGRSLAETCGFIYPSELEAVVWQFWQQHKPLA